MKWFGRLRQIQQILLDLIYPPSCACCGEPGAYLCDDCVGTIEYFRTPRCIKCDLPLPKNSSTMLCGRCERQPMPYLHGIRRLGPHKGSLRQAIHAFKYEKHQELAQRLGWLLVEGWRERARFQIDGLLPIPLHPAREQERGFNQSECLAQVMSEHLTTPLCSDILTRTRNTTSQVGLSASERQQNMQGAFVASSQAAGKRWLLVDDVCTTGSTLIACAHALHKQGAQAIWAITLSSPSYNHERQRWEDEPLPHETANQQPTIWEWNNQGE